MATKTTVTTPTSSDNTPNNISCDRAITLINIFNGSSSKLHHFIDSVDFIHTKFDPTHVFVYC